MFLEKIPQKRYWSEFNIIIFLLKIIKMRIPFFWNFLILVSLLSLGCSVDKEDTEENFPDNADRLTLQNTDVQTYQLVEIKAEGPISESYSGKIGNESVEIYKNSDSTLVFTVPEMSAGVHELKFGLGTINLEVEETILDEELKSSFDKIFQYAEQSPLLDSSEDSQIKRNFISETKELYSSLTDDEKKEVYYFWQANLYRYYYGVREENSDQRTSSGKSSINKQESCPTTNYKERFTCMAGNLSLYVDRKSNELKTVLDLFNSAGVDTYQSPENFVNSINGKELYIVTAGFLFLVDTVPSFQIFANELNTFLRYRWISTGVQETNTYRYYDGVPVRHDIISGYRSIWHSDGDWSYGTALFTRSMDRIKPYWREFGLLLGMPKDYVQGMHWRAADLTKENILISDISNPNVEYVDHDDTWINFRNLTEEEQEFTYKVTVNNQGFSKSKVVDGKLLFHSVYWEGEYDLRISNFKINEIGKLKDLKINRSTGSEFNSLLAGIEFSLTLTDPEDEGHWDDEYKASITNNPNFYKVELWVHFEYRDGIKHIDFLRVRLYVNSEDYYSLIESYGEYESSRFYYREDGENTYL